MCAIYAAGKESYRPCLAELTEKLAIRARMKNNSALTQARMQT